MTATRPPLSRNRILIEALALLDESGVEQLSMRRLGQRLGVDPMAIYHHIPSKTALLDSLVEEIWLGVQLPEVRAGESWQEVLCDVFRAFRERLYQHPRAVVLVGTRPSVTPAMLRLVDQILGRLDQTEITGKDAMELIDCLSGYTVGKVLAEIGGAEQSTSANVASVLAAVDAATHPYLARTLLEYGPAAEEEFERGLVALVTGWRLAAATAEPPRA